MEPITTRIGWSDFGDYDHFGKRLYRDLAGNVSFLSLVVFAVTGRETTREDGDVLDDIAVCLHVPEPRVWPLKLARVAASGGRFLHGLLVGCTAMDSEAVGVHIVAGAARLLVELREATGGGASSEDIAALLRTRSALPGFGVYGRRVDERVDAIRTCLQRRGRADRPFWTTMEAVRPIVQRDRTMDVHGWGAVAAALLDLGLAPDEMPPILSIMLQSSYVAHAVEGAATPAPALLRLPPEAIVYVGPAARESPRARAARDPERAPR